MQGDPILRKKAHDKENNFFRVKYPFLEDPREALTDNIRQAIAYAISLDKKLAQAEGKI